ncbi:cysteine proteinase [Colletotrichum caudatum]|nr:cysteine proteinase [Colletotrichum caudatum]
MSNDDGKKIIRVRPLTKAILDRLSAEEDDVPFGPRVPPPPILPDRVPFKELPSRFIPFAPMPKSSDPEQQSRDNIKNIPTNPKVARTPDVKPDRQAERESSQVITNVLRLSPDAVLRAYARAFQNIDKTVSATLETAGGQRPAFGNTLILANRRSVVQETLPLFKPGAWMNDTAVSLVLSKLVCRDQRFSTIDPVVTKSIADDATGQMERLQERFEQGHSKKDFILVPVNVHNQHWVLFVWGKDGRVEFFDSMASEAARMTACRDFLRFSSRIAPSRPLQRSIVSVSCPQQSNSYDCGLFVMRQADILTASNIPNYTAPPLETTALRAYYKAIFLAGNPK